MHTIVYAFADVFVILKVHVSQLIVRCFIRCSQYCLQILGMLSYTIHSVKMREASKKILERWTKATQMSCQAILHAMKYV